MMKVRTLHPFPGCPDGVRALSQPCVVCVGMGLAARSPSGRCIHRVLYGDGCGCYRAVTSMFFQRGPPGGHTGGQVVVC